MFEEIEDILTQADERQKYSPENAAGSILQCWGESGYHSC